MSSVVPSQIKHFFHKYFWYLVACWIGCVLAYIYLRLVTQPSILIRLELIERVFDGRIKVDHLYSMYTISIIFKVLHSFLSAEISFAIIDGLGLVAVFVNAWFFLSRISQQTMSRIAGLVWLAVTTPLLFRYHYYHPSDFVGVSIMFHMILAVYQKRHWRLSVLCLVSGLFWEKAILVPGIFFLWIWRNDSFKDATRSTLPSALSILIVFIAFRLFSLSFPEAEPTALPTYKPYFLRLGLKKAILEWLVWVLPVCVLLVDTVVNKRKVGFFWLIWLIYVPFLIGVLLYFGGNLYELRSFWILQPIFIGYIVSWFNSVYYSGDRDSDFSEVSI